MTNTTERIIALMNQRGENAHQLEIAAALPNASIQAWTKGKKRKDGSITQTSPSADSIANIARYFNVSADYLLCLSDEPTPLKQADIAERPTAALSTALIELSNDKGFVDSAKLYKAMPTEYRHEVCAYILGIATGLGLNIKQLLGR